MFVHPFVRNSSSNYPTSNFHGIVWCRLATFRSVFVTKSSLIARRQKTEDKRQTACHVFLVPCRIFTAFCMKCWSRRDFLILFWEVSHHFWVSYNYYSIVFLFGLLQYSLLYITNFELTARNNLYQVRNYAWRNSLGMFPLSWSLISKAMSLTADVSILLCNLMFPAYSCFPQTNI
jgi:hypothetical protein